VEGEVTVASQVEADHATTASTGDADLLGAPRPVEAPPRKKNAQTPPQKGKNTKGMKAKADQMALFAQKPLSGKKPAKKAIAPAKTASPRGKK